MTKVTFLPHEEICPEGKTIEVEPGISICNAALANDIEIEHACEKSCACTTCHVYVREGLDSPGRRSCVGQIQTAIVVVMEDAVGDRINGHFDEHTVPACARDKQIR